MGDAAANPKQFAVMGKANGIPDGLVLRRFPTQQQAADHALGVNMANWDDIWVEPVEARLPPVYVEPKRPFNIEWTNGRAYVVEATGRKIATLYGCQAQREFLAWLLLDSFGAKP